MPSTIFTDRSAAKVELVELVAGPPWGRTTSIKGVIVSLHPAGHLLGSGQVRGSLDGRAEVVFGDDEVAADPTCF